jgi:O-antigen/teichoic acid export membrane protein
MQKSRRLSKNALFAMAQVLVTAIVMLAVLRHLSKTLGSAQIGLWSLIVASVSVSRLAELGFSAGVGRFVAVSYGAKNLRDAADTLFIGAVSVFFLISGIAAIIVYLRLDISAYLFADAVQVAIATELLAITAISLCFSTVGLVYLNGLDGLQRSDIRASANIIGTLLLLCGVYSYTERYGLVAVAWAQAAQSVFTLSMAMVCCRLHLKLPLFIGRKFKRERLVNLARYGGSLQIASIAQLGMDPAIKYLLNLYGSLSTVGLYEIANRIIVQARSLIAAVYQLLIPHFAARISDSNSASFSFSKSYLKTLKFAIAVTIPYYLLLASVLPFILSTLFPNDTNQLITYSILLAIGWFVNTLALPAWTMQLASGHTKWPVLTQIAIAGLTIILGTGFGYFFGPLGVIAAASAALAIGSVMLILIAHAQYQVTFVDFKSLIHRKWLVVACFTGWLTVSAIKFPQSLLISRQLLFLCTAATVFVVIALIVFRDPLLRSIKGQLQE